MTKRRGLGVLILIFILAIAFPAFAEKGKPPVPPEIGGLKLAHYLKGEEALREIERLHGKKINVKEGYVAHYEGRESKAMLYISRASSGPQAKGQIKRMAERIRKGGTPFYHLKESALADGIDLYSAIGLGQVHYFYRTGNKVVWLAADPPVARSALSSLLKAVR